MSVPPRLNLRRQMPPNLRRTSPVAARRNPARVEQSRLRLARSFFSLQQTPVLVVHRDPPDMQRSRLSMERLPIAAARRPDCLFAVEEALRAALGQDRFLLAFQPVVSALTSETEYFECLLRMRDPADRLVPCGDFTAVADHPSVRLGFNVSARTACDRQWLRALIGRLRERPEHAARLVVEITE